DASSTLRLKSFIMLLAAAGRETRHAKVADTRLRYYFVPRGRGQWRGILQVNRAGHRSIRAAGRGGVKVVAMKFAGQGRDAMGNETIKFRRRLLAWYDRHRRDLPWRANRDPYRVWLSEIMLQQTRVAAVIAHYHEFLRRFPTLEKLVAAREASVLAAWSGLGYYRRAHMMHAAAKVVARQYGGKFPPTAKGLLALPGIGRYTAAAIASIAFGEAVAVVDGNVERVLQRVSGKRLGGEELWGMANRRLDAKRPGDFNQAMMELGAVVCTPRSPACLTCPLLEVCVTRGELAAAAKLALQKKCEIQYSMSCRDSEVFLVQRSRDATLMPGMWELPERSDRNGSTSPAFSLRHSITVTDYTVHVWREDSPGAVDGRWIPVERLGRVALTGLARKILRKAAIL
ncbi:MAG: A/G-specific adenine glycosylase, partial [Candidatus Sulfotelmatobacter sp.]